MEGDNLFMLSPATPLPRIWVGLWQLSSNAWGSAPAQRVRDAMTTHMAKGFYAFGARRCSSLFVCSSHTTDLDLTDMVSPSRAGVAQI